MIASQNYNATLLHSGSCKSSALRTCLQNCRDYSGRMLSVPGSSKHGWRFFFFLLLYYLYQSHLVDAQPSNCGEWMLIWVLMRHSGGSYCRESLAAIEVFFALSAQSAARRIFFMLCVFRVFCFGSTMDAESLSFQPTSWEMSWVKFTQWELHQALSRKGPCGHHFTGSASSCRSDFLPLS